MTAQIPEKLRYEGRQWSMYAEPLADYLKLKGIDPQPDIISTALWRGYVAEWEIIDDHLYLTGIEGRWDGEDISVEMLFPGMGGRVFAHWFSGIIRVPDGRLLKYIHSGYGSVYERDLLLEVGSGIVQEKSIRENGTATPSSTSKSHSDRIDVLRDFLDE